MEKNLPNIVSEILAYHGGIVEPIGEEMEFMIPDALGKTLGIAEHGRLSFTYSENEAIDASYDSEFFTAIKNVFLEKGKIALGSYPGYEPGIKKITKNIEKNLSFANATFRVREPQAESFSYLLVYFKYIALSDEKQEGLLSVLINELNFSTSDTNIDLGELSQIDSPLLLNDIKKSLASACSSAGGFAREKLANFIKSLERRLGRDIRRVYEYYETMKKEIKKNKKIDVQKLTAKIAAIEAEQQWKVQDLIARYALKIQVSPISMVRITTNSIVFWIHIKRRLASRKFPLTYNPITKKIDPLPCESCFFPQGSCYICDEHLHVVCNSCFSACCHCQKQFCKACHSICPKCKKKESMQ